MSLSTTLSDYLSRHAAHYDVSLHPPTRTSAETARLANVPLHCLAKSVLLEDEDGVVMAVVPADYQIHLGRLVRMLGRPLHLSTERRVTQLFPDCEPGAMPCFGMAWGVPTVVDEAIEDEAEVWIEGGDHRSLLHMPGHQFRALMRDADHGDFAGPPRH